MHAEEGKYSSPHGLSMKLVHFLQLEIELCSQIKWEDSQLHVHVYTMYDDGHVCVGVQGW